MGELTISTAQFQLLDRAVRRGTLDRLRRGLGAARGHLVRDEATWRAWCADVLDQAPELGATTYQTLACHGALRAWFGRGYAVDPCFPWLRELLVTSDGRDASVGEAADLIPDILAVSAGWLDEFEGEDGSLRRAIGQRVVEWTDAEASTPTVALTADEVLLLAIRLHPGRSAELTPAGAAGLLRRATSVTESLGAMPSTSLVVWAGLVVFGWAAFDDPLYPALRSLGAQGSPSRDAALDALRRTAMEALT